MNFSNYPKPKILLQQDSICGITWRGYLTRATLLAIGFGSYILLTNKKLDLSENGKRCFYALRKYFPRGKDDVDETDRRPCGTTYNDEISSVSSLESLKTGSLLEVSDVNANVPFVDQEISNSIETNEYRNQTKHNVCQYGDSGEVEFNPISQTSFYSFPITWWWNRRNDYFGKNFIFWCFLAIAFLITKLEAIPPPCLKFIGYGSIFDFLMSLIIIPTIYIWFTYRYTF